MMKIAIISINQPSLDSAIRLKKYLYDFHIDIFSKNNLKHNLKEIHIYKKLDDILKPAWEKYEAVIAILAIGAVVRKIAPLLIDKTTDPAILVIDLSLTKIIPLLSGHLGGANELANIISSRVPNCQIFISTATDQTGTLAFEMLAKKENWEIKNLKSLAKISNRLINNQKVKVATYKVIFEIIEPKKNLELVEFKDLDLDTVAITPLPIESNSLWFKPKVYIGIGCNRGTSKELIDKATNKFLQKYQLNFNNIAKFASFEAKRDEIGLLNFIKEHNLIIEFYNKDNINSLNGDFSKSASNRFFGLKGVAEPSAILASKYKELIIKKEIFYKSITLALAI